MTFELWPQGAPLAQGDTAEDRPRLTPYVMKGEAPTPCVIVCPGGGYGRRAPHEGEPVARWLNGIGVSAFVLDYRVAPYKHPAPLMDAQRAIRHIRYHAAEWNIDPNQIGILGFSAGGHLSASTGTLYDDGDPNAADPVERVSSRPDLMILCYPVVSFVESFRHQGSMKNLIGADAADELRERLSAERQVTEHTPPAFLWHTADDPGVPVENVLALATALRKHKVPFDLHVYESGRHGIGLAQEHPEAREWTRACELWLRRRGF